MSKADRIRTARLNAGLTLEELAEMCGTTKQTIYKYEQGIVTNIPTNRIEAIARYTGCTPDYLMGWTDNSVMETIDLSRLNEEQKKLLKSYYDFLLNSNE